MAVAIGHERTVFAVSDGLICDFVRVLEWGGGALDAALARSLDVTPDRAHEAKHQLALSGDGAAPDGLGLMQVEAARESIRDELRLLSQEIVSSLRFYQTRPGSLAIGEILVTGGGAELPGFAEALRAARRCSGARRRPACPREARGKKVKRPAESRVVRRRNRTRDRQLMRAAVNLLPREPAGHRKRMPSGQVLLAGTAPLLAAAFVYLGFTYEHAKVSDVKATVDVASAELSGLGPAASVASAGQQLAAPPGRLVSARCRTR